MKKTYFILKNNSACEGIYFYEGDYKYLYPGEEITLEKKPVNKTANISLIIYKKEIKPQGVPLNVKPVVVSKKVETSKVIETKTDESAKKELNEQNKQKPGMLIQDNIQKQNDQKKKDSDKE